MVLKNINKENNAKLALKRQGHDLINQIKWKGYSLDTVYLLLAKKMGVDEGHAHFARLQSLRDLKKAVSALDLLVNEVPDTPYKSKGYKQR